MNTFRINKWELATLSGFGIQSLDVSLQDGTVVNEMVRPRILKGRVLKIDPATGLSVSAIQSLWNKNPISYETETTGIVLFSQYGNHSIIREYANKVRTKQKSSALYAASGYNMLACIPAMVLGIHGPTVVLAGDSSNLFKAFCVAANYLYRQDVDRIIVGQVEIETSGKFGMAIMFDLHKAVGRYGLKLDWTHQTLHLESIKTNVHALSKDMAEFIDRQERWQLALTLLLQLSCSVEETQA